MAQRQKTWLSIQKELKTRPEMTSSWPASPDLTENENENGFKVYLPYCFKNSLHSDAYMSWDSNVHRILFETELQFPEKIKPKKYFFVSICRLFAKNAFFRN